MRRRDLIGSALIAVLWAAGGHHVAHWDAGQMVVYGSAGFVGCLMWDAAMLLRRRRTHRRAVRR